MTDWLDDYQRVTPSRTPTGPRVSAPPCIVLHTVEGDPTPANSPGIFAGHPWPPQLWVDLDDGPLMQAIPLTLSGLALEHPRGTPETNHMGITVQVEIEGRAAETHLWSGEKLRRLGEDVLAPIARAVGIDRLVPYRDVGEPSATGYGTRAPSRMTAAEWRTRTRTDGVEWNVCGHQNVPDNNHWDPGQLDFATACAFANRKLSVGGSMSTGVGQVTRIASTAPGKLTVEAQIPSGDVVRIYVVDPTTGDLARPAVNVTDTDGDGRVRRVLDVPGGTWKVNTDNHTRQVGIPPAPGVNRTVHVDEPSPAGPVGNPHPVNPDSGTAEQVTVDRDDLEALKVLGRSIVTRVDELLA